MLVEVLCRGHVATTSRAPEEPSGRKVICRQIVVGRPHMIHIVGHRGHPKRIPPPRTTLTRVTKGVAGTQGARANERTTPDYARRHMPFRADHSAREGSRPVCAINPATAVVAPHVADGVELAAAGERTAANSHQRKDHRVRDGV
jgi:hypothetical protein